MGLSETLSYQDLRGKSPRRYSGQLMSMDKTKINGVELTLMAPVTTDDEWVDYGQYLQQLQAAWLRLSKKEPPF
jgi:hypothetical protein